MFNIHRFNANDTFTLRTHQWVTVPNPINKRALLQACDNCGVVKSQYTVVKHCQAAASQHLVTSAVETILF